MHYVKIAVLAALVAALSFLAPFNYACAGDSQTPLKRYKLATIAPKGVGWAVHYENLVLPVVRELAGDDFDVKVFWGGAMGDDEEILNKMRKGFLQGAGLSGQGATQACPAMSVVELPFLFDNYDEVDYVKEKMTPVFEALFRQNGFYLFAWCDQDFDIIISKGVSFTRLEDFKDVRFMTWYGPLEEKLLTNLGADLVPLDIPEIAPAAQTGKYKAAIGPAAFVLGAQMHNVVRNINPCKIRYSPSVDLLTNAAWDAVPQATKESYFKRREALMKKFNAKVREDNERSLQALYTYGMKKDEFSPSELRRIKAATRHIGTDLAGKLYSRALLDELLQHLEDYRAAHGEQ